MGIGLLAFKLSIKSTLFSCKLRITVVIDSKNKKGMKNSSLFDFTTYAVIAYLLAKSPLVPLW